MPVPNSVWVATELSGCLETSQPLPSIGRLAQDRPRLRIPQWMIEVESWCLFTIDALGASNPLSDRLPDDAERLGDRGARPSRIDSGQDRGVGASTSASLSRYSTCFAGECFHAVYIAQGPSKRIR